LPMALVVGVETAASDWLRPFGVLPPVLATGVLFYGLSELGHFQKQERVWMQTLERTKLFALVNVGLSPFLYFWNDLPSVAYFNEAVGVMILCSLMFLVNLNQVTLRLAAMLPDETLREDTQLFTSLNLYMVFAVLTLLALYLGLAGVQTLPPIVAKGLNFLYEARRGLIIVPVVVPVAMTMALLWKIKEVVLASVFGGE